MNKKTFALALAFLVVTLVWLGHNLWGYLLRSHSVTLFDLLVAVLFVAAACGMVCHEFRKKRRRHLSDVDKHHIP